MEKKSKKNLKNDASKVNIILAYKDGEAFIESQLRSIAAQDHEHINIELFDDFSDAPFKLELLDHSGLSRQQLKITKNERNLGYCQNFLNGLTKASDNYSFFSFCDQDDIWFEDKITRAIEAISEYPEDVPCLYCSRTEIVDNSGDQHLGYSPIFTKKPKFSNALTQNIGGGNTMVMNKAARHLLIKASKDINVVSHDWWTYIVISGAGGTVIYDPKPTLKYRQHDHNLVGRNSGLSARLKRIRMLLQGRYRDWSELHVEALRKNIHLLSEENKIVLDLFIKARQAPLFKRIFFFLKAGLYRQTLLGNLGLFVSVILNKV